MIPRATAGRAGRRVVALAAWSLAALAPAASDAQPRPSPLQSAGTPQAAGGPAAGPALLGGAPTPGAPPLVNPLPAPPDAYPLRSSIQCADFRRAPGGGWSTLSPIQLPGPQGPVQLAAGQGFAAGDYVGGQDLGSILERDCRSTPPQAARIGLTSNEGGTF